VRRHRYRTFRAQRRWLIPYMIVSIIGGGTVLKEISVQTGSH